MLSNVFLFATVFITSAFYISPEPHAVGLEKMAKLLRGDVRLIAMGDSYSAPFYARVPLAALRVWPIHTISAISSGASQVSHLFTCTPYCDPVSNLQAEDDFGYSVERFTSTSYFTFPTFGIQEIYSSSTFDDEGTDTLFEFSLNNTGANYLSSGVHGKFVEENDTLRFRLLYRCPTTLSQQLESINVLDSSELVGEFQLRTGARPFWHLGENPNADIREAIPTQINAGSQDFPVHNSANSLLSMTLEQQENIQGTNKYFEPAGCVYYHVDEKNQREKGLYYSYIADGSWSYIGFGCDTEGNSNFDKRFTLEQLTHWLDLTTLDKTQTTVFMWFFAPEQLGYNASMTRMTDMIDQSNAAAKLVGLSSVEHLIVIGSMFSLTNDQELTKSFIRNQEEAAFNLATTRTNVAAASLFSITDETMFDGNGGIPWLLYHGFDHFKFGSNTLNLVEETNGNLFDQWGVHPRSTDAAAFFASLLGEMIREAGCPADIIIDGYIDTTDLLSVISSMGQEHVKEDINEDGIVNVQDILLVIDQWGDCWPVQAPYNSSAFRAN